MSAEQKIILGSMVILLVGILIGWVARGMSVIREIRAAIDWERTKGQAAYEQHCRNQNERQCGLMAQRSTRGEHGE